MNTINEFETVFIREDISNIISYHKQNNYLKSEIVELCNVFCRFIEYKRPSYVFALRCNNRSAECLKNIFHKKNSFFDTFFISFAYMFLILLNYVSLAQYEPC